MKCENWNCWKDCINLVLKAVFVGVFTWVRKLTSKKGRQPSLSKKTIKNLKF